MGRWLQKTALLLSAILVFTLVYIFSDVDPVYRLINMPANQSLPLCRFILYLVFLTYLSEVFRVVLDVTLNQDISVFYIFLFIVMRLIPRVRIIKNKFFRIKFKILLMMYTIFWVLIFFAFSVY